MAAKGTILVTGANGGLGSAIAAQIASEAEFSVYHGLYTVRNTERAPALTSALVQGTAHAYDILSLDLTKLDDVRNVAKEINVSPLCSVTYTSATSASSLSISQILVKVA